MRAFVPQIPGLRLCLCVCGRIFIYTSDNLLILYAILQHLFVDTETGIVIRNLKFTKHSEYKKRRNKIVIRCYKSFKSSSQIEFV